MSIQLLSSSHLSPHESGSSFRTRTVTSSLLRLVRDVAVTTVALLTANAALGQEFPSRPIRLIVPFTPGAGTDTTARMLAEKLSVSLGQSVVVDNRGGASGSIGTDLGAKAAADGYTWTYASDPPFTINPHLRKLSFDPLKDFVAVSLVAKVPLVLVANPSLPANTTAELVALAKQSPGKLIVSSSGNGTSGHLAAEYFEAATGTKMLHVPYKGQSEALTDVMAGRADLNFSAVGNVLQFIRAGKLKVIAVASRERVPSLREVPTIAEAGYKDFEIGAFHGLVMPAGTSSAIVRKVNEAVNKALQVPDVASRFEALGFIAVGGPPDALEQLLRSDSQRWANLIRTAHIQVD